MSTRETTDYDMDPAEQGKWLSGIVALLGIWLLIQAVWFELVAAQFWNDAIVGALLLALGAYNYYRRAAEETGNVGVAGLVALFGLWLIVSPFLLTPSVGAVEVGANVSFWNDVFVGLVALIVGAYSAYTARETSGTVAPTAR